MPNALPQGPGEGWQPIATAPFQQVIEVRNPQMKGRSVLATRGYVHNGMVHPDTTFCTTVFTPDPEGLFPTPAGKLCCPTEWREPQEQSNAA